MWEPSASVSTAYATANNLNQYPSVDGTVYWYDQNGCLTAGLFDATYDALNRLTQVISGDNTNNYWYDPMNRQAQKQANTVTTSCLYSGKQLIADYDASGNLQNRYIPGARLNEVLMQISGGTLTFLHQDRMGSTIAQTNVDGAVLNEYQYSPFGETASLSGTVLGFTGQQYDSEVSLYNYKARYYAPALGRFLQPDPLGYGAGDMNLYTYVGNDPANLADPLGLQAVCANGGSSGLPNLFGAPATADSNVITVGVPTIVGQGAGDKTGGESNGLSNTSGISDPQPNSGPGPGPSWQRSLQSGMTFTDPDGIAHYTLIPTVSPYIQEYTPLPNDTTMQPDMWGNQSQYSGWRQTNWLGKETGSPSSIYDANQERLQEVNQGVSREKLIQTGEDQNGR